MKTGRILIILSLCACTNGITKKSVNDLKSQATELEVYQALGEPTEWYKDKNNPNYKAYLYRNGNLHCALEFSFGSLFNRSCIER